MAQRRRRLQRPGEGRGFRQRLPDAPGLWHRLERLGRRRAVAHQHDEHRPSDCAQRRRQRDHRAGGGRGRTEHGRQDQDDAALCGKPHGGGQRQAHDAPASDRYADPGRRLALERPARDHLSGAGACRMDLRIRLRGQGSAGHGHRPRRHARFSLVPQIRRRGRRRKRESAGDDGGRAAGHRRRIIAAQSRGDLFLGAIAGRPRAARLSAARLQ